MPALVGRTAELRALDGALEEVARGGGGALELAGEPGIGKTRLLSDLEARADRRGLLILAGSASELEHELPFGVFVDALDEYVQAVEPRRLDGLDDETWAELSYVLPSVGARPSAALPIERHRTHRAVRRLLEALAERKPLVLALDDLHWADSGSIELLGALLRRPPARVLLAFAVRPRQRPDRLAAAIERAQRAGAVTRLDVGSLSPAEAGELLGHAVDDGLYRQARGNPFYLEQLARRPGAATLAAALADELATLGGAERRVLDGAAVAGDPFELELAAAAADVDDAAALDALDELLRRDLVRATDVPRRFRFRHPLVRAAVYESSPGGWRLGAHERSATALEARGAAAALRAHHVEQAARHGDAAAIAVLREAGETIATRNPAGAARWFDAALRLLPDAAPAAERGALLMALAGAQAASGQFADARGALLESLALVPPDAIALRVALTSACARAEQLMGRHGQAHARLVAALGELADQTTPEAVDLMLSLATDGIFRMRFEESRGLATRALAVARRLERRPSIAAAAAAAALTCAFVGATDEAERHRAEAAGLVDAMGDDELSVRAEAAGSLAAADANLDRLEESEAHARRAIAVARATAQGELIPVLVPILASTLLAQGRLAEAAELLDEAIEAARLVGAPQALALRLAHRCEGAAMAGDLDLAVAAGREAVELTSAHESTLVGGQASAMLAFALIESGEPARGVALIVEHGGGGDLARVPAGWRARHLERLTRGWLAIGRPEEAARAAGVLAGLADATGLRQPAALALRAEAEVALAGGDGTGAAAQAHASAQAADALGMRLDAALARSLAGRALAQAGERAAAVDRLRRAAEELDACGARRYRDAAERELGRLGQRTHRRTQRGRADATGVAALTARELEVARLIVDRRTNAEIASELFLSPKTVETHIRNLFHKLDVSSRVDVARAVERAGR
jgi:ATP/maltotriose-dependent transcriptional regulator MalT